MLSRPNHRQRSILAKVVRGAVGSLLISLLALVAGAPNGPPARLPAADPAGPEPSVAVMGALTPAGVFTPAVPGIRGSGSGAAVPGRYIVVLKDAPSPGVPDTIARAQAVSHRYGAHLGQVYHRTLQGFSAAMSQAQAQRMAHDPHVAYVEQDEVVRVADTQESPPSWGLDRVDQPALPLDATYSYDRPSLAVPPVTAYIIDTGIRTSLPDFQGRASWGWDFVTNSANADDCEGHGTHTAGVVGSALYGVAKTVRLVAVRAFDCNGNATASSLLNSVEWVTTHAVKPAVVDLSVQPACQDAAGHVVACPAGSYASITTAIKQSIDSGLSYVVAAGNANINACGNPFATVAGAVAVGATGVSDAKAPYSNWGSCIDLWAPGGGELSPTSPTAGILSDWPTNATASCTNPCLTSGTSPAAAFVTGAVARLLTRPGWSSASPAQVQTELLTKMVTTGVVSGLDAGSPNKMLYIPPPPIAGGSSIAAARNHDGRIGLFGVTPDGKLLYRTQVSAGSSNWSVWAPSRNVGWYSVAAETDGWDRVSFMGLRRSPQDIWFRAQGQPDIDDRWVSPHQLDGLLNSVALARSSGKRLEAFGTNSHGQLWQSFKVTVSGTRDFAAWAPFDLPSGAPVRSVTAELNANNLVEVFALTSTRQLWHRWEQTPDAVQFFTPWLQMDTPAGTVTSIAVARNGDGSLQLFAATDSGRVFGRQAGGGSNNWLPWSQLPDPLGVGAMTSLAAETNSDGRVALFGVDLAGQPWQRWQLSAGSTVYSDWTQLPGDVLRP
jgi:subtilase family protein/peptidase inhibitor I9